MSDQLPFRAVRMLDSGTPDAQVYCKTLPEVRDFIATCGRDGGMIVEQWKDGKWGPCATGDC